MEKNILLKPNGNGQNGETSAELKWRFLQEQLRDKAASANLKELKTAVLRGVVLDRSLLQQALETVFVSIAQIIRASDLSADEKNDLLRSIADLPLILEHVSQKQGVRLAKGEDEE
jgi:hypothetical protein